MSRPEIRRRSSSGGMAWGNFAKNAQDQNVLYSSSKIEPLKSPVKYHQPHDNHGVIGEDHDIEEDHLEPLRSEIKHHHIQLPHAETHGVIGYDDVIQSSKIAPFNGKLNQRTEHEEGIDDEDIDASRIRPMGEVREE
ncbi:uncharacterized protein EI97DRAFT_458496 [Westerdykella ornata]|uniref:Uncharacterized protein n=1 Tax=Westerdykella ornata TaxID=318751 RepID=A0A6A6JJ11_WESOR|nr:uncharacterized protein EI97DRAFT_458496 [Westerdykella ornata]KAF2276581.1 hypothetical protein EI97DRAFT_458496 [Westerdykella ornata]